MYFYKVYLKVFSSKVFILKITIILNKVLLGFINKFIKYDIVYNLSLKFGEVNMKIRKEDVYEHLEMLYEIVGDEKYLEIIRMYGGSNLYIPTYKATIRNSRNREIRKRYNGVNLSLLAAEYGMSVNNLRNIVKED